MVDKPWFIAMVNNDWTMVKGSLQCLRMTSGCLMAVIAAEPSNHAINHSFTKKVNGWLAIVENRPRLLIVLMSIKVIDSHLLMVFVGSWLVYGLFTMMNRQFYCWTRNWYQRVCTCTRMMRFGNAIGLLCKLAHATMTGLSCQGLPTNCSKNDHMMLQNHDACSLINDDKSQQRTNTLICWVKNWLTSRMSWIIDIAMISTYLVWTQTPGCISSRFFICKTRCKLESLNTWCLTNSLLISSPVRTKPNQSQKH